MQKKRIFIYMHYLEIGGAERALIGLLNALDPDKVQVDLFLNQHTGEFLPLVPGHVNLLPELPEYSAIERPIKQIVKEGHFGIAARRIIAKYRHKRHIRRLPQDANRVDNSIFQYVMRQVIPTLRPLSYLGEYDLAISFLHPHNIVLHKVRAKRKICWIHTDYSTVYVNRDIERPVWGAFDRIVSISDQAAKSFVKVFPELSDRLMVMENILSAPSIRLQALMLDVSSEMPAVPGEIRVLSIGRFCAAKRFEMVPELCRLLLDKGLRVKWYIIGFGDDAATRANIERWGVEGSVVLLGKKANPYPYIAACDVYAQPSLYEGKSVTVREAQILCRPVVITAYPTAGSQVADGIDGRIVPLDADACADGIADFLHDTALQAKITDHLSTHDYGNESETTKIYSLLQS